MLNSDPFRRMKYLGIISRQSTTSLLLTRGQPPSPVRRKLLTVEEMEIIYLCFRFSLSSVASQPTRVSAKLLRLVIHASVVSFFEYRIQQLISRNELNPSVRRVHPTQTFCFCNNDRFQSVESRAVEDMWTGVGRSANVMHCIEVDTEKS